MSQQQMQQRPSVVNGVGRRRMDRDLVNRAENYRADFQNFRYPQTSRSGSNIYSAGGTGHHFYNHTNNDVSNHIGGTRPAGERGDASTLAGSRGVLLDRPLHDRLLFMTACLIGQPVEVQVKNGSIYSGIFHTANAEKDYGVVLKMARLTKDGSVKGGKGEGLKDAARKAPVKTLIIHAKDIVQITAKDVPLSGESLPNGRARENRSEIVTDTLLSQSRHLELERELKPWTPDKDDPKDLGLESTFQNTWNRNWDQFETNKALFGVESTFDEELYTTKLERGPQMREREREAWRIAREIEGQATKNIHIAEERGVRLAKELEALDEESRYSSVLRPPEKMDIGEDNEDRNIDLCNDETFGDAFGTIATGTVGSVDCNSGVFKAAELESRTSRPSSAESNQDAGSPYHSPIQRGSPLMSQLMGDVTSIQALNLDPGCPQVTEDVYRDFNEFKQQENAKRGKKQREEELSELKSFSESLKDLTKDLEPLSPKLAGKNLPAEAGTRPTVREDLKSGVSSSDGTQGSLLTTTVAFSPPASALPIPTGFSGSIGTTASNFCSSEAAVSVIAHNQAAKPTSFSESKKTLPTSNSLLGPTITMPAHTQLELPSTSLSSPMNENPLAHSNFTPAVSTTAISPSSPSSSSCSSTGATSTKKSILNPNAKEFKLNPNAKAFTPSFNGARPLSPVVQGPIYVPGAISPIAPMQGIPVGVGLNPLMQQPGQPSKFTPFNSMAVATAAASATSFLQPPGTYSPGVSGAGVPPTLPGQPTLKMPPPQVQPSMVGHSFGSQPPIRFSSQGPPVQPAPAYFNPNGQLYPQQMMFGQPGQVLYIQHYPQEMVQGPPLPPPQPVQPGSQQGQQQKQRGGVVQGMQVCIAPPFLAGQQHFLQQSQMSHLHNPLQPTPGLLPPTSMPGMQPLQGMVAGMAPAVQSAGNLLGGNTLRVGGKLGGNYQQQ